MSKVLKITDLHAAIDGKEVTCPAAIQRSCPSLAAIRRMASAAARPAA